MKKARTLERRERPRTHGERATPSHLTKSEQLELKSTSSAKTASTPSSGFTKEAIAETLEYFDSHWTPEQKKLATEAMQAEQQKTTLKTEAKKQTEAHADGAAAGASSGRVTELLKELKDAYGEVQRTGKPEAFERYYAAMNTFYAEFGVGQIAVPGHWSGKSVP
jgi:hypothetical protein